MHKLHRGLAGCRGRDHSLRFHPGGHRRQHSGHSLRGLQQTPPDRHQLLHRQLSHGRPAPEHHRAAFLRVSGGPGMLGVRPGLLQHLGCGGCALLHRVHPQPLHHLHRPLHRRQTLPEIPEYHDGEESGGYSGAGLGVVHGHLGRTAARMEGTAAGGRKHLQDHGGAGLRALLLSLLLLPPALGHPHHVLQGVRGGPQDYQQPGSGCQTREEQVDGGGSPDTLPQRAGGRAQRQQQKQQEPPVPKFALRAADEVLPGEEGCENPRHRGGDVHLVLAAFFLLSPDRYVLSSSLLHDTVLEF